ncbi:GNAT family N-acetyltransferase [bacterium]|nr:GNAT family N-acetyltransferase [bacterium]
MITTYTGERVRLRPWRDFAEYSSVIDRDYAQPDPFRGPRWWPVLAREPDFDRNGEIGPEAYSQLAIEELASGQAVGITGHGALKPGALAVDFGTYILPDCRYRGYGVEAKQLALCRLFENYPLEAVRANTTAPHGRARRSLELCGMQQYGRLRRVGIADGRYYDEVQYEIYRPDWELLPIRQRVKRG